MQCLPGPLQSDLLTMMRETQLTDNETVRTMMRRVYQTFHWYKYKVITSTLGTSAVPRKMNALVHPSK